MLADCKPEGPASAIGLLAARDVVEDGDDDVERVKVRVYAGQSQVAAVLPDACGFHFHGPCYYYKRSFPNIDVLLSHGLLLHTTKSPKEQQNLGKRKGEHKQSWSVVTYDTDVLQSEKMNTRRTAVRLARRTKTRPRGHLSARSGRRRATIAFLILLVTPCIFPNDGRQRLGSSPFLEWIEAWEGSEMFGQKIRGD